MEENVYLGIVVVLSIIAALVHHAIWSKENSGKRPYRWGFFSGYGDIISSVFIVGATVICLLGDVELEDGDYFLAFFFILMGLVGVGVIKRMRVAFIIHTILSLNPILWVINGIYIKNRWKELD